MLPAVVIIVPRNAISPDFSQTEEFLSKWETNPLKDAYALEFLDNVCSAAEVISRFDKLAKKYVLRFSDELLESTLGTFDRRLTFGEKELASEKIQQTILKNWDNLLHLLLELKFNTTDIKLLEKIDVKHTGSLQHLLLLLRAVKTKLIRVARNINYQRACLKLSLEKNVPYGLILEGDIFIGREAKQQIDDCVKWLEQNDPTWNILQIGWTPHKRHRAYIPYSPVAKPLLVHCRTIASLVNLRNGTPTKVVDLNCDYHTNLKAVGDIDDMLYDTSLNIYVSADRLIDDARTVNE